MNIQDLINQYQPKIKTLDKDIQILIGLLLEIIEKQDKRIKELEEEIKELKEKLNMDSSNSSKPPSSDSPFKNKNKSQRVKSNKKPGGQKGHKGKTLERFKKADKRIEIPVNSCQHCEHDLKDLELENIQNRQVLDIPEPKFEITEYIGGEKRCPCCNKVTKSEFPPNVAKAIQYGPNIAAHSIYLSNYQMLTYNRTAEYWSEIYNIPISQGSIYNFNKESYKRLEPIETSIIGAIMMGKIMHNDETGIKIDKKLHWIHVACNKQFTYYYIHKKRGKQATDDIGLLPFYKGISIHDWWKSYLKYTNCEHAFCNSHLSRETIGIIENENARWAYEMRRLLLKAKKQVDLTKEKGEQRLNDIVIQQIHKDYKKIIELGERNYPPLERTGKRGRKKQKKGKNLLDRFRDYREETLRFVSDFDVPFDNNLAERDLRMNKVKEKISGCFRSYEGGQYFCRIRGYISTCKKQNMPVFEALRSIFTGDLIYPKYLV